MRYATMNLGLGVGSVCGALLADLSSPGRMELLFVAQAALFLVYAAIASRLPDPRAVLGRGGQRRAGGRVSPRAGRPGVAARVGARRRAVRRRLRASTTPRFRPSRSAPAAWGSRRWAWRSRRTRCTIVAAQLLVLRLLAGWRRSRALALVGVLWAAAWAVALAAGALGGGLAAAVIFAAAMALFGLGETALAPALAPLVNDLATDELRGRYNGASALACTTGFMLGPALAGLALGAGLAHALLVALAVVCLFAALGRASPGALAAV